VFESTVSAGVLRIKRPDTRWLSSGWAGGFHQATAAYNVAVPEEWDRQDVGAYLEQRRRTADFPDPGPALLTGVDLEHARGARAGPVEVFATAGLSNPAALPMTVDEPGASTETDDTGEASNPGTVNLIVGTDRALDDGTLASLLALTAESKAATLIAETGFPGTTTDAVIVGSDPTGEPSAFAGSATEVGGATRVCVRDAVRASLHSRFAESLMPTTVEEATYGLRSEERAQVFLP